MIEKSHFTLKGRGYGDEKKLRIITWKERAVKARKNFPSRAKIFHGEARKKREEEAGILFYGGSLVRWKSSVGIAFRAYTRNENERGLRKKYSILSSRSNKRSRHTNEKTEQTAFGWPTVKITHSKTHKTTTERWGQLFFGLSVGRKKTKIMYRLKMHPIK